LHRRITGDRQRAGPHKHPLSALFLLGQKKSRLFSVLSRMLKKAVSKAAGESKPEAYPLGYVEDFDEPRTKLAGFFSILPVVRREA
jgi:hypothetical protein